MNTYQPQELLPSLKCLACPEGYDQSSPGRAFCVDFGWVKKEDCDDNSFLDDSDEDGAKWSCKPCPHGGSCLGNIAFKGVIAKFGYARCHNNPSRFEQCAFAGACLGGPNPNLKGKYFDSEDQDLAACDDDDDNKNTTSNHCREQCNVAYVNGSNMCHACASHFSRSSISVGGGRCDACPEKSINTALAFSGMFVGLFSLIVYIRITINDQGSLGTKDGIRTILLSFLQLLSLLVSFDIAWPTIFVAIFQVGGAVTVLGEHLVNVKVSFQLQVVKLCKF